jgi:hypothetical protein
MEGVLLVIRGVVMVKKIKPSSKNPGQVDRQIEVATRNGYKRALVDQAAYDACPEVGQPAVMTCNVGRIEKGEYGATNATEITFLSVQADRGVGAGPAEGSARSEMPPIRRAA